MTLFLQAAAAALIAVVLGLALEKQGKDIGLLLTMLVCVLVLIAAVSGLKPVIEFLDLLQSYSSLGGAILGTLLRITGIGLVSEIAAMICGDAGRASLGKALQILSSAVILWLSLPLYTMLLEIVRSILGGL